MCVSFRIQWNWPMCHRFIRKMIIWRKTITGLWAFCHHYLKFMRESWVNNSLIFLTKSSLLCCQLSERDTAVSPPFWIWSSILKKSLDNGEYVACLSMDPSKAFDCLPHCLTICKLHSYGVSREACTLIASYLRDRKQRIKLGNSRSEWTELFKGVPQGSILGPLIF